MTKQLEAQFACVDRAVNELGVDRRTTSLDLFYADKCAPLDFERLLVFPAYDFAHDIFGIARHMNRETRKIKDCFLPRCAK